MKKTTFLMAALAVSMTAFAADTTINRAGFGSGTPSMSFGNAGVENGKVVNHDASVLHTPQYMPNYPTAAPIWPRVVEVPCTKTATGLACEKYYWTPAMGRGEYLFYTPTIVEAPKTVEKTVTVLVPGPERIILKEVPVKPKDQ